MAEQKEEKIISKLRNIKVRYFFTSNVIPYEKTSKKYFLQINKIKLSIYKHSPSQVNLTGLNNIKNIDQYKKILEHIFKKKIFNSVIDCFFYSKKNYFNLKISELICQLKEDKRFFIFYNPEIFCGVMVHSRSKELPTMMLYRTGSWVIMGGKTLSQIKECENFLLKAISKVKNN